MSWGKLSDQFHSHPKVIAGGNEVAGVYARAISYCADYSTDGFVSGEWAKQIAKPRVLDRVTATGLWITVEAGENRTVSERKDSGNRTLPDVFLKILYNGFFIPDYLHYNPSRVEVEVAKARRQAAGSKGGTSKPQADTQASAKHLLKHSLSKTPPKMEAHSRPVLKEESSNPVQLPTRNGAGLGILEDAAKQIEERLARQSSAERLLDALGDGDEGTPAVIAGLLDGLPDYAVPVVLHELAHPSTEIRSRTRYAVGLLTRMRDGGRQGRALHRFGRILQSEQRT